MRRDLRLGLGQVLEKHHNRLDANDVVAAAVRVMFGPCTKHGNASLNRGCGCGVHLATWLQASSKVVAISSLRAAAPADDT